MLLKSHFLPVVICIFVLQTMQNFKKMLLKNVWTMFILWLKKGISFSNPVHGYGSVSFYLDPDLNFQYDPDPDPESQTRPTISFV